MSSRGRQRSIVIALGAPGCGKTTALTWPLVRRYLASGGRARILDPAGAFGELGEWPGRARVEDWIDELTACGEGPRSGGWGPGLLVLDDADRYLTSGNTKSWRDVWLANRHLGLDLVMSAHRPQGIPKDALGSAQQLWLFMQDEPHAVEYLSEIPVLRPVFEGLDVELPDRPGLALRVDVRSRQLYQVDLFEGSSAPADVDVEASELAGEHRQLDAGDDAGDVEQLDDEQLDDEG